MRLVSIISAWADTLSLLPKCIENHLQFSDGVIVCWSTTSNHGVRDDRMLQFVVTQLYDRVLFHQIEPVLGRKDSQLMNETRKRNSGIEVAKREGYTHYIVADSDEFYIPEEVKVAKTEFNDSNLNGLVSYIRVFVGKPTLWCVDPNTVVPFIHRLTPKTYVGNFREYPYTYKATGIAQIDPSRRVNEIHGIRYSTVEMWHYSYVRENIDMKIKNSTAKLHKMERAIKKDMMYASPGWKSAIYNRELKECENIFGI
jgi:hypothetical protein